MYNIQMDIYFLLHACISKTKNSDIVFVRTTSTVRLFALTVVRE
jgi:hypothetical protein